MAEPKPKGAPRHQTPDTDSERQGHLNRSARRHGAHWLARVITRTPEQVDAAVEKDKKGGK